MVRVDRQQLEPEPEPIRRHPVADWRPHTGPTRENHPKFLLPTEEPLVPMSPHMAGQHFEHIVFGANQHACWLRCTLCEKTSRRVIYRYTICMKCPGRRREDYEPLWETSTRCVLVKWNCLLLRLFWMGSEDTRAYFANEIRNLRQRRQFVDVDMIPKIWNYSMKYTSRILVIPKDPAQANPLKGWNNAYHETRRPRIVRPGIIHVTNART